jgi:hypothetical protein
MYSPCIPSSVQPGCLRLGHQRMVGGGDQVAGLLTTPVGQALQSAVG